MPYHSGSISFYDGPRPRIPRQLDLTGIETIFGAVARSIQKRQPLILTGPTGLGKTALMAEIDFWTERGVRDGHPALAGRGNCWIDAEQYCDDVKRGWKWESDGLSAVQIVPAVHQLFLDDLGIERATDQNHDAITSLLRRRHLAGLPTWVTTNLTIDELTSRYGARTVSRLLENALVVPMRGADRRLAS